MASLRFMPWLRLILYSLSFITRTPMIRAFVSDAPTRLRSTIVF